MQLNKGYVAIKEKKWRLLFRFRVWVLSLRDISTIMANQMEENMQNEMETEVI